MFLVLLLMMRSFLPLDNGLQLTTYEWEAERPLDRNGYPIECVSKVLEGRLDALTFENVPVANVKRRMECERLMREEGPGEEVCTCTYGYHLPISNTVPVVSLNMAAT